MTVELSIILPAYNEEPVIRQNLLQVKKKMDELHLNYEIIVVDDGSTDDIAALLEDDRLKCLPQNQIAVRVCHQAWHAQSSRDLPVVHGC